ncbi:MAG: glycosyltransferase [Syntrophaceae bacterium]
MGAEKFLAVIVMACGGGNIRDSVLDTLESVEHYCPEPHSIVILDDCTTDGTYEAVKRIKRGNWHLMRTDQPNGIAKLTHTLQAAFRYIVDNIDCRFVLKIDSDALMIHPGILTDAVKYMESHPRVGVFGVHKVDYNRPRTYVVHARAISRRMAGWRIFFGLRPAWYDLMKRAEANGYDRGDNIFCCYFLTMEALRAMYNIGALNMPYFWKARIEEDVYFPMASVAAGYELGHFAAPEGPLCLEWKGLPLPARELWEKKFKLVHSVDKGFNTGPAENAGKTAREVFRELRRAAAHPDFKLRR